MPEFSPKSDKYPSGESSTPSSLCYCHRLVKEEIFLVLKSLGLRDAIYVLLIRNWRLFVSAYNPIRLYNLYNLNGYQIV
jgi:hypothetical protein